MYQDKLVQLPVLYYYILETEAHWDFMPINSYQKGRLIFSSIFFQRERIAVPPKLP